MLIEPKLLSQTLRHARHLNPRRAMAEMQAVGVVMAVSMVVMVMPVGMIMFMGVALHFAISASANCTHYATSKSLIRISSPPIGISLPPPQSGHGSSRFSI